MSNRWWVLALGMTGFLAGRMWHAPDPRHWSELNGEDWRALGPTQQTAFAEGFLAGAAFGQAAEHAADSAGLTQAVARMRHDGHFRLPYGANVYISRINDYYWWENHRPFPLWYAFWEVNSSLTGPTNEPAP